MESVRCCGSLSLGRRMRVTILVGPPIQAEASWSRGWSSILTLRWTDTTWRGMPLEKGHFECTGNVHVRRDVDASFALFI